MFCFERSQSLLDTASGPTNGDSGSIKKKGTGLSLMAVRFSDETIKLLFEKVRFFVDKHRSLKRHTCGARSPIQDSTFINGLSTRMNTHIILTLTFSTHVSTNMTSHICWKSCLIA